jgi:hypothetical protein
MCLFSQCTAHVYQSMTEGAGLTSSMSRLVWRSGKARLPLHRLTASGVSGLLAVDVLYLLARDLSRRDEYDPEASARAGSGVGSQAAIP